MPGFAVYYRYPNSQRVTYSQFIKVSSRTSWLLNMRYSTQKFISAALWVIFPAKLENPKDICLLLLVLVVFIAVYINQYFTGFLVVWNPWTFMLSQIVITAYVHLLLQRTVSLALFNYFLQQNRVKIVTRHLQVKTTFNCQLFCILLIDAKLILFKVVIKFLVLGVWSNYVVTMYSFASLKGEGMISMCKIRFIIDYPQYGWHPWFDVSHDNSVVNPCPMVPTLCSHVKTID